MIFGDLEQVGRLTKSCIRKFHYQPKRSFGQGYIFTGVCDSVHRGGVSAPIFRGGGYLLQFFGRGVSAPIFRGRGCLLQFFGGVSNFQNTVNVRPVSILLECILVITLYLRIILYIGRRLIATVYAFIWKCLLYLP